MTLNTNTIPSFHKIHANQMSIVLESYEQLYLHGSQSFTYASKFFFLVQQHGYGRLIHTFVQLITNSLGFRVRVYG
jgi:hypothetical protein